MASICLGNDSLSVAPSMVGLAAIMWASVLCRSIKQSQSGQHQHEVSVHPVHSSCTEPKQPLFLCAKEWSNQSNSGMWIRVLHSAPWVRNWVKNVSIGCCVHVCQHSRIALMRRVWRVGLFCAMTLAAASTAVSLCIRHSFTCWFTVHCAEAAPLSPPQFMSIVWRSSDL